MTSDTEHDGPDDETGAAASSSAGRRRSKDGPRPGPSSKKPSSKKKDGTDASEASGPGRAKPGGRAKTDKADSRRGSRPKRSGALVRVLVVALAIELIAAVGVLGVVGTTTFLDWQESRHRAAAVDAARVTVGALMTISPTTIDENFALVEENSTGAFAEEFAKTADTIRETVMTYATEQSAEILRVAWADGDTDSATVLLAVDTATVHQTPVGAEEEKDDEKKDDAEEAADGPIDSHYRVKAHMALVDGVWLLAELEMAT